MPLPQIKHPGYTLDDWKGWEGLLRLEQGRYQEAQRVEWRTLVALLGGRVSIKVE